MHLEERLASADPIAAQHTSYDICVVGAGIVGSALAYSLGQSGRKVLLIERDLSFPDRIVGELLQPGGCASLSRLGMLDCLAEIDARVCRGYQVYWGSRSVPIPYPPLDRAHLEWAEDGLSEESSSSPIPPAFDGQAEGRSFHHGRFVQSLRKKAASSPNVTLIEATVNEVLRSEEDEDVIVGVRVTPSSKAVIPASDQPSSSTTTSLDFEAPLTLITDGYASKFRRLLLPERYSTPQVRSHFVALLLKDAILPAPGHGHVILKDASAMSAKAKAEDAAAERSGGPVLVYQLSKHDTRMLVDVPGPKLPSLANGDLKVRCRLLLFCSY